MTQILSQNSLKPTSEHLLCSVRTRLRLANAFNGQGLQDLAMYPVRSLQGSTHAIYSEPKNCSSFYLPEWHFFLPVRDQIFEKNHHFHKSYTHTLAHNAQERSEWRPGIVDLKHACMALLGSISCNYPIAPSGLYHPAVSQPSQISPPC